MENRDVLREIFQRLDDETLAKVTRNLGLYREVATLLGDNTFWYRRTELLSGMNLTDQPNYLWRGIYYHVLWTREHTSESKPEYGIFNEVYLPGLSDLDALMVLFEIYGVPLKPAPRDVTEIRCRWINSPEVLRYLLDNGFIIYDQKLIQRHIELASEDENSASVLKLLLTMLDPTARLSSTLLLRAAREGRIEIVKALLPYQKRMTSNVLSVLDSAASGENGTVVAYLLSVSSFPEHALWEATMSSIEADNREAFELLLDHSQFDKSRKEILFSKSIHKARVDIARFLLDRGTGKRDAAFWRQTLNAAISDSIPELVSLCLEYISPATKGNQALKIAVSTLAKVKEEPRSHVAARIHSEEVLSLLLSDKRVDPNSNIRDILIAGTVTLMRNKRMVKRIEELPSLYGKVLALLSDDNKDFPVPTKDSAIVADILIRNEKTDIEMMSLVTLRLFLWTLHYPYLSDALGGFDMGTVAAGEPYSGREEISELLERGTDLFSELLRHIILKRPSGEGLLDWMIARRDRRMEEAARSIIDRADLANADVRLLRSLMLIVLYPTLTLKELLSDVDSDKIRVAQLVGAYLGRSGIQARD